MTEDMVATIPSLRYYYEVDGRPSFHKKKNDSANHFSLHHVGVIGEVLTNLISKVISEYLN